MYVYKHEILNTHNNKNWILLIAWGKAKEYKQKMCEFR